MEITVYDGWNVIAEISDAGTKYLAWGRDLSGTLQGAGGVGGLLAIGNAETGETHYPSYDGNGNVIQLTNTDGGIVATYEYDPFGNIIHQSGPEADNNPWRFSTKYLDSETGFYYYGFRYYSPKLGRWVSRDPIEERGGENLYGFVGNDGLRRWDYLGNVPSLKSGANVTNAVKVLLSSVESTFGRWSDLQKCEACFTLLQLKYIGDSWDVHGLFGGLRTPYRGQGTTPQGLDAGVTVAFNTSQPEVFFGSSVAYSLWGKAFRECHDWMADLPKKSILKPSTWLHPNYDARQFSKTNAKLIAAAYKMGQKALSPMIGSTYDHPVDSSGAIAFTGYGYDQEAINSSPIADIKSIPVNPKIYDSTFDWTWLPHQDPRSRMSSHNWDKIGKHLGYDLCCPFR